MPGGHDAPRNSLLQRDVQLIQIVDAALADATQRAGDHLACRPGCTQCCYGAFSISPLDALRLRTDMAELAQNEPERAATIAARAARYLAEFSPEFPGNRETGILGSSEADLTAFEDFANDAPCPALDPETGLCEVYAARPMTCRVFGPPVRSAAEFADGEEAFSVCELCFTQATPEEITAAELRVPYDEEERVLALLDSEQPLSSGDTIIAYCLVPIPALLRPASAPPS